MVEGEAVQSFTMLFLQMWNISEKGQEDLKDTSHPRQMNFEENMDMYFHMQTVLLTMRILASRFIFMY